jgi:S-adenosylmethionine-diacylglycerol 3-amino-3-carboxypropyl transferase
MPCIAARASFDQVRYANCWEDATVLCEALAPNTGSRILSIASAGDNTLALLAEGASVVAADLSAAQLACLELRCAAFRRLDHPGVLAFLGVAAAHDRLATFTTLAADLSAASRAFWSARPAAIAAGIIHAGRFETYFRTFRRFVLPLVHGRRTVERLLEAKDEAERSAFYSAVWDNRRWRLLIRLFFSRLVMGGLGRDPEFFRYVEGPVGERILARARHALTRLPTHANPFLEYILTGTFARALPRYLEPGRFDAVRSGLARLTLHCGPIEEAARLYGEGGFDGFNLSDIFEYVDPALQETIYRALLARARPGARLAYWNMLAPRRRPAACAEHVRPRPEARSLHERDLGFFYSAFVLEEVGT